MAENASHTPSAGIAFSQCLLCGRQRGPDRIVERMAGAVGHWLLLSFSLNCTATLAVIAELGDLAALPDLGGVAPDGGPRAINIRKAIVAGKLA